MTAVRERRLRLAIFGSHAIPYRVPLYRLLARHDSLDLLVVYGSDYGLVPTRSVWGIEDFVWAGDLGNGYPLLRLSNWAPRSNPSTFFGKINPDLQRSLRSFRPDAVVIMGYAGFYQAQAILGSLLGRRPILYLSESQPVGHLVPAGAWQRVKASVLARAYGYIAAFLVIGSLNREHYQQLGVPERKLFPFPYAVDNECLRNQASELAPQRAGLRAGWGIRPGVECILFSGRLAVEKNIPELIRAVSAVTELHLLIAGGGPQERYLRALAAELLPHRHTFAGFLNQDELVKAYAAADMLALVSVREPWGLVCNEAMNFGLPLVLSDRVGAAPDLVTQDETGWLYPVGHATALVVALRAAVAAMRSRRDVVRSAVLRRVEGWSFAAQATGLMSALESVV